MAKEVTNARYRYLPMLRTKAGEAIALKNLDPGDKSRLLPIVHVLESPPRTFPQQMSNAWNGRMMALDGLYNFNTTGSPTDFTTVFQTLAGGGINVIPSVSFNDPPNYVQLVQNFVGAAGPGLVVKVSVGQLQHVAAWVNGQGWNQGDVDLLIECGSLAEYDMATFSSYVAGEIASHIAVPLQWRSVTLASSAAPQHLGQFPIGQTNVPRLDWQLWNAIAPGLQFQLDYGDFGTLHPDLAQPPWFAAIRGSISVRYTTDNEWVILKGYPTSGRMGQPMGQQFRAHAQTLTGLPNFGGLANCWGDQRIQQIANGASGPGGKPTWVQLSMNRHLSLVADRLP